MSDINKCEFPKFNATSEEIRRLLQSVKTIAVVGISAKEDRPSHWIAKYLKDHGYHVIGVNPGHKEVAGIKVYKTVLEIPDNVDLVDIFLRPENIPPVVEDAITKKVKAIWMQEGIVHNESAEKARLAGLAVVMNKCIYKEHASL